MSKEIESIQLSRLLPAIRQQFSLIPDQRDLKASALGYHLPDVLMGGLAMMFLLDPAMLEFQRRLEERQRSSNLKAIFGIEDIPKESQFRRILDPIDPSSIQEGFQLCIQRLQKTRLWRDYRLLDGRYAVLMDGFEFFRSDQKGCDHCLEFHHQDGHIDYAHKALAACIAHPTAKRPLPLLLEEIRCEDGATKQDCEFNAARRLIPKLAKQHCHMDLIINGDGLFSKLPMVRVIRDAGLSYILVAKPTDHKTLEENIAGLRGAGGIERWEITTDDGRICVYEWVHGVELVATSDEKTNWFSYTETSAKGKRLYHNTWITDLKPNRRNIQELVEVGRHRWQIENEVFNILKNHGHHLEHNFGHGKEHLAFNFVILNFLAYMLHQLIALADRLFQAVQEWSGTRYRLWNDIRVLFNHFIWGSWEALLKHILDLRDDTGLESG